MSNTDKYPLRLIVVEDHIKTRQRIVERLRREGDFEVVSEINSASGAIEIVDQVEADVMILDIGLQGKDEGLRVAEELARKGANVRVLVFSAMKNIDYLFKLLASGSYGYVFKKEDSALNILVQCLRKVREGERCQISQSLCVMVSTWAVHSNYERPHLLGSLGDEEKEVVRLTGMGFTDPEISEHMLIRKPELDQLVSRIYKTLNITDRYSMVEFAWSKKLVEC